MGKGKAFKNVICLGHLMDKDGKKMSKSLGNGVDPWEMMNKYGSDVLRFWMYSINQPGESKNFDEKTVDEVVKKVPNLLLNIVSFYEMYKSEVGNKELDCFKSPHVLDRWILALLSELISICAKHLDSYNLIEPGRGSVISSLISHNGTSAVPRSF